MYVVDFVKKWVCLIFTVAAMCAGGCDKKPDSDIAGRTQTAAVESDAPLASFRVALLDMAIETATAIPVMPHIKDRSRAQQVVADVCLKLQQPNRALGCIEKIDNWRRGVGYADLAIYYAQQGQKQKVQTYLEMAKQIAQQGLAGSQDGQVNREWRTDHIRSKIAQTYAWIGHIEKAAEFEKGVAESESGKTAGIHAMVCDANAFDAQVVALDALIAAANFDITKNAIVSYVNLFDRFYPDAAKRTQIEDKIKTSWAKMPIFLRIEWLTEMAGTAVHHNDSANAVRIVDEAQQMLDGHQWPLDAEMPLAAKLAAARFQAGDTEKAKSAANTLREKYGAHRDTIVNIYRAGVLCSLAQAYQMMGDKETALSVYKQAIQEGVENPNSRPRAEDLSATCCSMAVYAVEPDAELWGQIHQIHKGLGQPW